ncbi:MAG TPA: serine/threonine-protein kinase [Polyangiaceae bacterium]|nr:serine/threonine-protein kinase [Polyangiaceae bacterium]
MSIAPSKHPLKPPTPSDDSGIEASEDTFADDRDRSGETLEGRYELLRKIGKGGMGEVYEARHLQLGRVFAVKLLLREHLSSKSMRQRFVREIRAASSLESMHIVSALDCGHASDGAPYYVMELLRGESLGQLVRDQGRLSVPRALALAVQLCRGLSVAHSRGLVHRDLKPENVFVVRDDSDRELAKILDFGLVRVDGGASLARAGSLIGTVRYMAPEQAADASRVDARADIYALGAILYESLTGCRPHPGDTAEEVLFHTLNSEPEPPSRLRPSLPREFDAVVLRALERDPAHRFTTAFDFAAALERLSNSVAAASSARREPPISSTSITRDEDSALAPTKTSRRERWRWTVMLLTLLGSSGLMLCRRSPQPERASNGTRPPPVEAQREPPPSPSVMSRGELTPHAPADSAVTPMPREASKLSNKKATAPRKRSSAPVSASTLASTNQAPATNADDASPATVFDSENPYLRTPAPAGP